jgi:predicted transcriptional regulator
VAGLLKLARRNLPIYVGRNYKNVHADVTRLAELGLIERRADQRIAVAWNTIAAEMSLAA